MNEHPLDMNEHPLNIDECPLDSNEYSLNINEHPLEMNEHLLNIDECPLDINEYSLNIKEHPLDMNEHPLDINEHPLNVNEHPLDIKEHPLDIKEHPLNINEHPLKINEQPLNIDEFPLVSVVLGTFNGEPFLQEQLRSVLAQTYPNLEILAIDDGSSDGTVRILREFAALDPRIRIVINERNLGFIRNFEKGCRLSKGQWIALCDQDDYWMPDKVAKMVSAIGPLPMVYCDSELCGEDLHPLGKKISDLVHYQSFDDCRQLCVFSRMYGHATLITRELFDKATPFLEEVPHDGWLAFHATLYGGVAYLPEVLVKYRQHAGNIYGVVGRKKKKQPKQQLLEKKRKELRRVRIRMAAYYQACPDVQVPQKRLLGALVRTYRSFSPANDIRRVWLFLTNYRLLLAVKNYSSVRKILFCFKMLVKIK